MVRFIKKHLSRISAFSFNNSGIVFRLDDLGYLLIGNSRVDKRHTNVTITEKGKQLIQETEDIYQEIIGKMKVIISDEEMNTIIQSVDQIKELFK